MSLFFLFYHLPREGVTYSKAYLCWILYNFSLGFPTDITEIHVMVRVSQVPTSLEIDNLVQTETERSTNQYHLLYIKSVTFILKSCTQCILKTKQKKKTNLRKFYRLCFAIHSSAMQRESELKMRVFETNGKLLFIWWFSISFSTE